jgi:hypothetical protein
MTAQVAHDHALPWTKEIDLRVPVVVGAGHTMNEDEGRGAMPHVFIEELCPRQGQGGHGASALWRSLATSDARWNLQGAAIGRLPIRLHPRAALSSGVLA